MFKHLKYIDGSSDKFWEIQTNDNSHTVTYGRNGTSGQSKTKSFDSEDACLKDAEKLILEKTKKGYSEDGSVIPSEKNATGQTSKKPSASALLKEKIVDALHDLIKKGNKQGIIPFLDLYAKGNLELIKKELRIARRYYITYVDLTNEPQFKNNSNYNWGYRGTENQHQIINLLSLAVYNQTEARTVFDFVRMLDMPKNPEVWAVLQWAKPTWLTPYLLDQLQRNKWARIGYWNLRYLEENDLVTFEPELYARSVSRFDETRDKDLQLKNLNRLVIDALALKRDIPLVFEYETAIHTSYYDYNYQNKVNELLWHKVFDELVETNKLSKEVLLSSALEIQTKNWNSNLKSFFRGLILRLNADEATLLAHQHQIFPLLHSEDSSPINFAINLLKPLLDNQDFDMNEFLIWVEPNFMRTDLKGGIKTLLIQFDKLMKSKPEHKSRIVLLVTDVFMISDFQLQERASKFILKHQASVDENLSDKLNTYSAQMLGSIAQDLKSLMGAGQTAYSEEEILATLSSDAQESYTYQPQSAEKLVQKINYPSSWNDILFQVGHVIHTIDEVQMEILMNAWMMHSSEFPEDYKKQLEPYVEKLKKTYVESNWFAHFSSIFISRYYDVSKIFYDNNRHSNHSRNANTVNDILVLIQQRMFSNIQLPLLSLPTHEPFWIDPVVLIERILDYEKQAVEIDLLDLSIALSRTVRENLQQAETKLVAVKDEKVRQILSYALGFENQLAVTKKSWLSSIIGSSNSKDADWIGIWATVARSNYPEGIFDEFEETALKDAPYAVRDFRPEIKIEAFYYDYYNYTTKKPHYMGEAIKAPLPPFKEYPKTFLYAKEIFNRGNNPFSSYYMLSLDVPYAYSLMPQNPDSVSFIYGVAYNSMSSNITKSSKSLLELMLYPFFEFSKHSLLFLATSCFGADKLVRATCVEVLIQTIAENRLPIVEMSNFYAFLLNGNYGPYTRFVEVLEQCKDVSAKQNDALFQLIEGTVSQLEVGEKTPTNFKKFLELFYDLQQKGSYTLSEELSSSLKQFNAYKAVQPILKKILN
ncbi:DUF6493 family protein [Sphingobacterium hungaricum]|uniref:WGR domain-containing protein n=1 Tax=Sphingobacterium hungaricum TaxID=2082723 RepID=A0A928YS55_9SPHI|nr:DUF6493 family protein [Sphingobacterium hungaricum]MBE8714885.1 hypothetical protein [Sphingobacterium hungaricum]